MNESVGMGELLGHALSVLPLTHSPEHKGQTASHDDLTQTPPRPSSALTQPTQGVPARYTSRQRYLPQEARSQRRRYRR